jgi:transmembrane sensor
MTDPDNPFDDATLARYLAQECTPEEQLAIRAWLDADPARRHSLNRLRDAWTALSQRSAPPFDVQGMRHRLAVETGAGHLGIRVFASKRHRSWFFPAIAAVLMLVIGTYAVATRLSRPAAAEAQWREITTDRWQRADVYLSDGSYVQLAPQSRLRFMSPLSDTARDVNLVGRALFEVTHDERRPFRVHTARGIAEDLGTRFDVKHYEGDSVLNVVVAEGLVALSSGLRATNRVTLGAGDHGTLGPSGKITVRHSVDVARALGWATGRLSFDRVPLRDVISELRRFYDIEFILADSALNSRRLTASFGSESPAEVVRIIALSLELRYEMRGKTVTLAPQRRVR